MSFRWTDRQVRVALSLNPEESRPDLEYGRITTDSRGVEVGDLFLALRGERFDGHDFVLEALAQGARAAVVESTFHTEDQPRVYPVPDTLQALGRLAHHRRNALGARVVGVTGSSGKTSTKDLLAETLLGTLRLHATSGNLNNRIGLPLTLLAAPSDAEAVVLEMGTNEPGEIRALTEIAAPEIGVITTVSETHLEKLGSLEGVLEEKLDLFRGLPEGGLALVGDEPPVLAEKANGVFANLLVTGWSERARPELRPEAPAVLDNGCYRFFWKGEAVELGVPGRHSVQNALLALAVAEAMGVPAAEAAARIGTVEAGGMRSEVRALGGLTLVVDCYNANPQSLRAALDLLATIRTSGRRVAVLGSMLELGGESKSLHQQALRDALACPVDLIVATGLFAEVAETVAVPLGGPEMVIAPELDRARDLLLQSLGGDEVVLLKASRGVAMESLIPSLEARFGPGKAA